MKVLAICNIDEEILKKSSMDDFEEVEDETILDLFRSEFAWMYDSGVSLEQSHEVTDDSLTKEYQIFLWRKDKECYVPVGNSMHLEALCRNRLKEAVAKGWIPEHLDPNRFQIMERPVFRAVGPWKAVDQKGEESWQEDILRKKRMGRSKKPLSFPLYAHISSVRTHHLEKQMKPCLISARKMKRRWKAFTR